MESFFLAETTKYLYLLFDHKNFIHNDGLKARIVDTPNGECIIYAGGYIFNTEAHPVDPAIVHCCSAQRQAEREAVRKWEDQYDFLSILDHHQDSTDHSEFPKETLPEFLAGLKKITEDPSYLESSKGSGAGLSAEQLEEIEFEIDESFLKNDSNTSVESPIEEGSSEIGLVAEEKRDETFEVNDTSEIKADSTVIPEDMKVDGTVVEEFVNDLNSHNNSRRDTENTDSEIASVAEDEGYEIFEADDTSKQKADAAVHAESSEVDVAMKEKPIDDPSNHDSSKREIANTELGNVPYSQNENSIANAEETSEDGSTSEAVLEKDMQNPGEHADAENVDATAEKQRALSLEDRQNPKKDHYDGDDTTEEMRLESSTQIPSPLLESPKGTPTTVGPMPPFVEPLPPGALIVPSMPLIKGSAVRAWKTKMTQKDLLMKIRSLIHQARLHDEEKLEQGEVSDSADRLVTTMVKIHSDYADLIKEAKELDDEYFEELKLRAERVKMAAMIPVVTAVCVKCCYPTEEIGESASFRHWMNIVYKVHIFPKQGMNLALGPLCWPYEEPRVEDNYHNVAPEVSPDTWLPGDVPVEVFYNLRSLTCFEVSDATDYKFDLLLTPPLGFSSKFIGVGQVALPANQTWGSHF